MTIFRIYDRLPSCISMEAGARPELNAQRYAERWLSLPKPSFRTLTTTGTSGSGKVSSELLRARKLWYAPFV